MSGLEFLILAAGKGVRAESDLLNIPKVLLPIDNNRSILETTLDKISALQDASIIIVTGFLSEKIDQCINDYKKSKHVMAISNIKNDDYNNGVLTSLLRGLSISNQDVVVMNGDTIYPVDFYNEISSSNHLTLFIEASNFSTDSVKVYSKKGRILQVGKGLTKFTHNSLGCLYIPMAEKPKIIKIIKSLIKLENSDRIIWHEIINEYINEGKIVDA